MSLFLDMVKFIPLQKGILRGVLFHARMPAAYLLGNDRNFVGGLKIIQQ